MSPGADLFVVCKQCGSEVSPYITECPYCGHRLRRRAPKLPRAQSSSGLQRTRARRWPVGGRTRSAPTRTRARRSLRGFDRGAGTRPYATIALVAVSCGVWVAWRGGFVSLDKLVVIGPLNGDWWKLFTSQFAYANGLYEFVALVAIGIFGWLLERRHGPAVVLAVFFGAGVAGALVASAVYSEAVVSGANGAALGLLAAWAVPDLEAARAGIDYDGDLLGVAAIAAVLLALPFAQPQASWLAGITGGAFGLVAGLGLSRVRQAEL
jgi:membrane associated rhomboid family serine protease